MPILAPLVALGFGCGDVQFVPSPFTPQEVQVLYSAQEEVTIVRWRVSAPPPVDKTRFELLGPNGYQPIDFSQSVYPGGVIACGDGDGTCAQYVLRGRYLPPPGGRPLRAIHDRFGALPGGLPEEDTVETTFGIDAFFGPRNAAVYVNMVDAVAAKDPFLFPRPYERAMWATNGLCVSDFLPDGVRFSPFDGDAGFAPEQPLSDNGTYCVASRPRPSDGGPAAVAQVRVATLPMTETRVRTYRPPVERSPILYQIVFDLEIPVADQCALAIPRIEALVRERFSAAGVPVIQLPTVNLAQGPGSACAQNNERTVRPAEMAEAVKAAVTGRTETHHQFHLLYFNNLDAPLPAALNQSFQALFVAIASAPPPGYDLQLVSWLFNQGLAALSEVYWTRMTNWASAQDDSFEQELDQYLFSALPYQSQIHVDETPVPFMPEEELRQFSGQRMKVCTSSPFIQPVFTTEPVRFIFERSWPILADDPPGYLVSLPIQISVPRADFVEASVQLEYQVCTRYCVDHPYVSKSGIGVVSWDKSPLCATEVQP